MGQKEGVGRLVLASGQKSWRKTTSFLRGSFGCIALCLLTLAFQSFLNVNDDLDEFLGSQIICKKNTGGLRVSAISPF